ncbi:hypothetical protein CALVIDRAFT_541944 [Calocera viscosa TUFC12733]|uniref:Uncharacterized protein n=1 Tax=Calocera viscosa (strain TUFC12733) TaxID=1330018 RepID=A0A167H7D4_CALVF|nr:hypothetical protein CALVIDRAFT_541944 [Calocera viscosa TUFC12733]
MTNGREPWLTAPCVGWCMFVAIPTSCIYVCIYSIVGITGVPAKAILQTPAVQEYLAGSCLESRIAQL